MPVVIGGIKYKSHDINIENNMAIDTFLQVSTAVVRNVWPHNKHQPKSAPNRTFDFLSFFCFGPRELDVWHMTFQNNW